MTDTVADWTYYTDFPKVYKNVSSIKVALNIMNSLIGSKNIQEDFLDLYQNYPEILKVVPLLIAKRLRDTIIVKDPIKISILILVNETIVLKNILCFWKNQVYLIYCKII